MNWLFPLAKRFIAGHDFESAKPVIDKLIKDGYRVSIDYLGELSKTTGDCEVAYAQYSKIIAYYQYLQHYENNDFGIDISVKPSQLGLKFDKSLCYEYMHSLVAQARTYGMTVRLDMEDDSLVEDTIDLCLHLKKEHSNIGVALQTNMYRTKEDLQTLMNNKVSIRLVKGAYKGHNKIAYQNKKQIKDLFLKQSLMMLSERCRSYYFLKDNGTPIHAIGTHDLELIQSIIGYLKTIKIQKSDFDFELLYGIRRDLSKELKDKGYRVRLYVPFGTEWLPYTLRRLKEIKNLKFVVFNIVREIFRF